MLGILSSCPTGWGQQILVCGSQRLFQGSPRNQNCFLNNTSSYSFSKYQNLHWLGKRNGGQSCRHLSMNHDTSTKLVTIFLVLTEGKKMEGGWVQIPVNKESPKNFITPLPLSIHLFNILLWWNEKCWLYSMLECEACAELVATLHEHHFYLKEWQTVVIQHFLWNEESLLYTENNWQYLLPMITFHLSNEN